ncbi:MAG: F0F1 ATP synthase subunit alpha [Myxococcales bacterium]|nr:F0F1 ATP synthase subunit alpha [Myxococcales bacterium]
MSDPASDPASAPASAPDDPLRRRLEAIEAVDLAPALRPRGFVAQVGDGVARVVGLRGAGYEELVRFDSGTFGMAYDLAPEHTGVILLTGADGVRAGEGADAAGALPSLPVGPDLFGRIVDPLGRPLDDRPPPAGARVPVFREAPALFERAPVCHPLFTGIMAVDAAIPIGRGQRQLIVGDRNVGKTALALDVIAAQRETGVVCVHVVIGQPLSRVLGIRAALAEVGALDHTVIVAADAAQSPGLQYLAPYAGTAIAEYFRDQGRDALVVYDDLTKHADAYRELALLLGRPPGREAFPGDIFYIHAELLERATPRSEAAGGGSITALPIVETTDSDISAYIPTNLISITDGQIYLDAGRFERNLRPAVDVGKSVSRIGGVAQPPVIRKVAHNVRIDMARFEALETLTRVGLDVDPRTRQAIERGRILRELLRQPRFTIRGVAHQVVALAAVSGGWLDGLAPADAARVLTRALAHLADDATDLGAALGGEGELPEGWKERLRAVVDGSREAPG